MSLLTATNNTTSTTKTTAIAHTPSNRPSLLLWTRQLPRMRHRCANCSCTRRQGESSVFSSFTNPVSLPQSKYDTLQSSPNAPCNSTHNQMHSITGPAIVSRSYRQSRLLLAHQLRLTCLALLTSLSCLATVTSAPATQSQPSPPPAGPSTTQQPNDPAAAPTNSSPSQQTTTLILSPVNSLLTTANGVVTSTVSQTIIAIAPNTTTITATTIIPVMTTTITTTTTSSSSEKSTKTHLSSGHSHLATPSETPNSAAADSNKNDGIMLIVSLAVIFFVLASMGLVVYCLFRRRTAKRRLHLFGKGNSSESFSANGLENISNDDLGAPSRANSNRRASDMDMSKALQEMTEQHQSALLSGKSSTLSLGQGAKAGNRMLSPTLSASRPYSQGTGYWTSPGAGLGIASNGESFIPAPMESSHDYRGSQYSDYYGVPSTPQHPPYFGAMGGSLDFNSNDQLLSPNHYLYRSGSPNNNVSRRSSLSPGSCPQPEGLRSQGPLFRAKTISTSSGHSYQASGHGTPYHSHPYPYYGYPPPGQAFHAISNTFTAESSSDDIYESDISRSTAEPHLFATATAGYDDMHGHNLVRPQSPNIAIMGNPADGYNTNGFVRPQSINKGVSPNIEIPPSITTRRRSANGQYASQGQSSYYQQQLQQNLHSISQEQSNLNRYPIAHPDKTQILDHEIETKDDKVGNIDGSGSGPGDVGQKASGKT